MGSMLPYIAAPWILWVPSNNQFTVRFHPCSQKRVNKNQQLQHQSADSSSTAFREALFQLQDQLMTFQKARWNHLDGGWKMCAAVGNWVCPICPPNETLFLDRKK